MNPDAPQKPSLRQRLAATRHVWLGDFGASDPVPDGYIDFPRPEANLPRATTTITGWALFPAETLSQVEIWLGEESLGRARLGLPRDDVALIHHQPHAATSGFELTADLGPWGGEDGAAELRVVATGSDGTTHEFEPIGVEIGDREKTEAAGRPLAPPAPVTPRPAGQRRPHVLVVTHQLNLGGAQLYLLDLLRELIENEAIEATVVSCIDGSVRGDLEDLGIPVHLSSLAPMDELGPHIGRVEELTEWAAGRGFDAAFINTATAFTVPGAEAASRLGVPAIWAIHESFPTPVLWSAMTPDVRERAEATLAEAARVVFEAEATKRLYEPLLGPSQGVTLPYGLDLGPIEAERAEFEMAAARREAAIPDDADVILCVGTVEPRKAQIPLAHAFGLIAARHPDAHLVIVGGSENPDSRALAALIEEAGWGDRMRLVPVTPDVHSWYALADLLVCASDIESLPRTVLEAMAFGTPVLATEVFGLPELIEDGKTGWLCEPRDVSALAEALDRFLETDDEVRRQVAEAARTLVEERHNLPEYANQIAKLLGGVIEDKNDSQGSQRRIVTK